MLSNAIIAFVVVFLLGGRTLETLQWGAVLPVGAVSFNETLFLGLGMLTVVASVVVPRALAARAATSAPTDPRQPLARAFTPFILGLAVAESCTLLGLVSAINGFAPPERVFAHAALAIGVMLLFQLPTTQRMRALAGQ